MQEYDKEKFVVLVSWELVDIPATGGLGILSVDALATGSCLCPSLQDLRRLRWLTLVSQVHRNPQVGSCVAMHHGMIFV